MKDCTEIKRVVIKVGTSTLAYSTGLLNLRRIRQLVEVISDLKNTGLEVVLVSSGAIGVGAGELGFSGRPHDMPTIQACASVGQCELMQVYSNSFLEYNHRVSQVLMTRYTVDREISRRNLENTLNRLLQLKVIPIVNENDAISTEEIEFGDNDTLSAIVGKLCETDLLVILSDIDGLFDSDPHKNPDAKLIPYVEEITPDIQGLAGGQGSHLGTGGMVTKIHAAQMAMEAGFPMLIMNGSHPEQLYTILDGQPAGTWFEPNVQQRQRRQERLGHKSRYPNDGIINA